MKETEILFDQEGGAYFFTDQDEQFYLHEFIRDVFNPADNFAYTSISNTCSMGIRVDATGENVSYEFFTI